MSKIRVGDLLPGSVFKISDESNQFLIIDKNTSCLMFYYDSNEMSAAVNTTTGKMISIENNKDVIPLLVVKRNDIRNLEMYESFVVDTKADLYACFKVDESVTDIVLDGVFKDLSEECPAVINFRCPNKTFIVTQYGSLTPDVPLVYKIQRVKVNHFISNKFKF